MSAPMSKASSCSQLLNYMGFSRSHSIYHGQRSSMTYLESKKNSNLLLHKLHSQIFCDKFSHILGHYQSVQKLHSGKAAKTIKLVLGIETSCDDTGAAVVDEDGKILGEDLYSQQRLHTQFGGILPPVARDLHKQHIADVVQNTLNQCGISIKDLDAIATTVEPGLPMSLTVGLDFSKKMVKGSSKPFIPIHHMEAHALTARMIEPIEFPFLVLLISGGHCLLSVVRDVDDFILIGKSMDDAPGDALDKTARRLRLKNMEQYADVSGGRAIEMAAQNGNPLTYELKNILKHRQDCNFSFAGMKSYANRIIEQEEKKFDIKGGAVLPNIADICASFQYLILHHLAKRVQRGLLFCHINGLLPENPTLVMSGGVASNMFIRKGIEKMCSHYDCRLVCPPPKLCTDNGIMIAWNGMEKLKKGIGTADIDSIVVRNKSPLGDDWTEKVLQSHIKLERVKILD